MSIAAPERSPKRELARKLFDAALSGVPFVGGPLAALYSVTHPAKGQIDQDKWANEVSNLLNSLEEAVDLLTRSITLSEDAAALGKWLSQNSQDGWSDLFGYDAIVAEFPEATKLEILEAVGELEIEGMVSVSNALGKPFSHILATHKLFEVFDPIVFEGVSPRGDAAEIAERLLASEQGISAREIAADLGWETRRINPALAIVGEFVAPGRRSQTMGQPYVFAHILVDASERAQLRRFVNLVRGQ